MKRRWSTLAKDFWTSVGPTAILVGFLNPGSYIWVRRKMHTPYLPKIVISWVFNEWNWSIIHWLIHWLFPALPTVCPTARNFQSMQKLIIFVAYFQTGSGLHLNSDKSWYNRIQNHNSSANYLKVHHINYCTTTTFMTTDIWRPLTTSPWRQNAPDPRANACLKRWNHGSPPSCVVFSWPNWGWNPHDTTLATNVQPMSWFRTWNQELWKAQLTY